MNQTEKELMQITEGQISTELENYTCQNSNFDIVRDYISMSHMSQSVDEILKQYENGFPDTKNIRLKCYKGYQMEKDLVKRMKILFGSRIETGIELIEYNGLIKGHPDFMFDQLPGDCKSVLLDNWLPKDGKIPTKVYFQMQAYMKACKEKKGILIYESRETGKVIDIVLKANKNIQDQIEKKYAQLSNILNLQKA